MVATQALTFDVTVSLSGILATARVVRSKSNIALHEKGDPFFDYLVEELGKYQKRTIVEFENAVDAAIAKAKPRMVPINTKEDALAFIKETTKALRDIKEEGRKLVFTGAFPLRMMICWLDALDMAIEAHTTIENRMESPVPRRKENQPDDVYSVSMGTGILLVRIEEQKRLFRQNRSLKIPGDEGPLIDDSVQALARDMAYLTRIQGQHHLLPNPAQEDLAVFREFLAKNYSETA
jgi:hypothetical protein